MSWDWQVFCKDTLTGDIVPGCYGTGGAHTYLNWLMSAWGWTVAISFCSLLLALAAGMVIGTMRTLPQDNAANRFWARFAYGWIELFRNIPLLVQIFIWYFVVPAIFPALQQVPRFLMAVAALGFFTSPRIAEQMRAGIFSLPRGQRNAALALGMSTWQSYRHVLLPNALRIIVPPLTSESMNIVKNSAAVFAMSIAELTQYAMQVQEETARGTEVYLAVTTLYILTALAVNRIFAFIEKRSRVPGLILGGEGKH